MFNVFGMIEANHTVLLLVEIYLYCIVLVLRIIAKKAKSTVPVTLSHTLRGHLKIVCHTVMTQAQLCKCVCVVSVEADT